MMAVALLAAVFGATSWVARMRVRSADYRRRAVEFEVLTMHSGSTTETADGRRVALWDNENTRHEDDWAWRLEAKYLRLSYSPWMAAEPDPPPPRPVAHPRWAAELPERDYTAASPVLDSRPPAWTFLWTWHPQGSVPWG
jgi:hypothetical protein